MLLALAASWALAAEPLLGPDGWLTFGPITRASGERDQVTLDPGNCTIEVRRVDLDGGTENRDVRLARTWAEGAWRWEDDWRVVGGRLERPGHAPVPVESDLRLGAATLEVDRFGGVVARTEGGRRLEIVRDAEGAFVGMRAPGVEVRISADRTRGSTPDGREVRYRWEGPELRSVADPAGVRSLYSYEGAALSTVGWSDGSRVLLESAPGTARTRGVGGEWRCEVRNAATGDTRRVVLTSPAGVWTLDRTAGRDTLRDPTGSSTRVYSEAGRISEWTDPRGGVTRLTRDEAGRVDGVTDPSGRRWAFEWAGAGLAAVVEPDGARWGVRTNAAGAATELTEPTGRSAAWERDGSGRTRAVRLGGARWALLRDAAGRVTAMVDPTGARVEIGRDGAGAATSITDPSGGRWSFGRDVRGVVVSIDDPGTARWEIERDTLGRPVGVRDPTGLRSRWGLRDDGSPTRVDIGGARWELLWGGSGALAAVRDPEGRTTGWSRDALGRASALHRADGQVVTFERDAAGELVGVGPDTRILRDASGRPLGIEGGGLSLVWDRDAVGRVVGVSGDGIGLGFSREPGGALREVRVEGAAAVRLARDAQGRVAKVEQTGTTTVARDAAGRVVALAAGTARLSVERDMRGLPARLGFGDDVWSVGRDAVGRDVSVEARGGARLGVDRDVAGRPTLARFGSGELARLERTAQAVTARIGDSNGHSLGVVGWSWGPAGLLDRVVAGATWLLRRDPLGTLVVAEAGEDAWSSAPDGIEGPGGAFVRYDAAGRPAAGRLPDGWGGAWGLGEGELVYEVAEDGGVRALRGQRGRVELRWDGAGRLTGWSGAGGEVRIARDALGRLVSAGEVSWLGWQVPLARAGVTWAAVSDAAVAWAGGGVLLGPDGAPVFATERGPLYAAPHGVSRGGSGEVGPGGRVAVRGGPLLGLFDALDPVSGQGLGPGPRWPWAARCWEMPEAQSPWPAPDAASTPAWDDFPWAARSPWGDPITLLTDIGELPDSGSRAAHAPGLPWLPASLGAAPPTAIPDPLAYQLDDDPIVALVLRHAAAPTTALAPTELTASFLAPWIAAGLDLPPGLLPVLPPELRAADRIEAP